MIRFLDTTALGVSMRGYSQIPIRFSFACSRPNLISVKARNLIDGIESTLVLGGLLQHTQITLTSRNRHRPFGP